MSSRTQTKKSRTPSRSRSRSPSPSKTTPSLGYIINPNPNTRTRHPFIKISNRAGSVFLRLLADPVSRKIVFRENADTLARAGYTEAALREQDIGATRPNAYLFEKKEEVKVRDKSHSASGWHVVAVGVDRAKLPARCLLEPEEKKYPVCGNDAVLSCPALRSAKKRAHIQHVRGTPGAAHVEALSDQLIGKFCEPTAAEARRSSRRIRGKTPLS